jgi:hypothetical protein
MARQLPRSMTRAGQSLLTLVVLGAVAAALTVVLREELVDSWAAGSQVRVEGLAADTISPPAFVPVAITLFVVLAALIGVLHLFVREGHGWARLALSALVALMALAAVAGLRTGEPAVFVALSLLSVVLDVTVLVFLWQPDTSAYLRGAWLESHAGPRGSHTP